MEKKLFKKIFSNVAKSYGFSSAFGGWYKRSDECIVALELQRSNYSHLYYLNIYIYIQGYCGQSIQIITKSIMKGSTKDLFRREDKKYSQWFDQENGISNDNREQGLETFFKDWMLPFTDSALTKKGIVELIERGELGGSKRTIERIQSL